MPIKMASQTKNNVVTYTLLAASLGMCVSLTGCAEGVLWRTGQYVPWAQNKWIEEEKIADTLFVKKREMRERVEFAINGTQQDQQNAAKFLAEIVRRNSILLHRIYAVKLLGQLDCPASLQALQEATENSNSEIRIAAIGSLEQLPADESLPRLQEILMDDSNTDVRLAAARAIGEFSGEQAIAAVAVALDDQDPALQRRVMQSLEKISGEPLGIDLVAWEQYVKATTSDRIAPTRKLNSTLDDYFESDTPKRSADNSFQPKVEKSWQTP
ncbi:MAG: HEAT repeat domain-containing protein [Mariniblastus sp.]|nr:HEAT repeat domain-containing protein [Mariniblastus sp.]MDG2180409.1 HEAT repeat domain-containing protein [Mariniblastus sp.]